MNRALHMDFSKTNGWWFVKIFWWISEWVRWKNCAIWPHQAPTTYLRYLWLCHLPPFVSHCPSPISFATRAKCCFISSTMVLHKPITCTSTPGGVNDTTDPDRLKGTLTWDFSGHRFTICCSMVKWTDWDEFFFDWVTRGGWAESLCI